MRTIILAVLILISTPAMSEDANPPPVQLDCKAGPITKTYGGTSWLVYACNDSHSLVMVSAPESRASPFVFMLHWEKGQYQISGEGTGDRAATDVAFKDIGALSQADIDQLLIETDHKR